MKKWEIWMFPVPDERNPHPVVIISPALLCDLKGHTHVNALSCTSLRPGMKPRDFEVLLNGADGLDDKTLVDCSQIYLLSKSKFIGGNARGVVQFERRTKILKILQRLLSMD